MASTLQLVEKVDAVFTFDGDAFCFGAKVKWFLTVS